jgi:hypothetical protein
MTDTFIGVALGVLLVATLSFLYGLISAWIRDNDGTVKAELEAKEEPTRSEKMRDAGFTRRPKGWVKEDKDDNGTV